MPIPVNNATGAVAVVDQKLVAASMLATLANVEDYARDFSQEFTAPIEGQRTSTVIVRKSPTVALAAVPADRNGLLARTGVTANSVEVTLTGDEYFKVGVDTLGVAPGQVSQEIGAAGAEAIAKAANRNLLSAIETEGTAIEFGGTYGAATTGQQVWDALLGAITALAEAEYSADFIVHVRAGVWAKLISDVASIRGGGDPREMAATLLGVKAVRVVAFPTATTLASVSHVSAVAQAKVLSGVREDQEDFDRIVEGRIKYGTKVLEAGAVRVIKDLAV